MIFSSIHANDDTSKYPVAIQQAIEYLKSHDFTSMETGVYEINGKLMYAQVMDCTTGPLDETHRPEFHKKFIDVQFVASGEEKLGFTPDYGKYELDEGIEERDLYFVKSVENEGFIISTPGCYSMFFPNDVHRPGLCVNDPMTVRKVVVKVSMELLK